MDGEGFDSLSRGAPTANRRPYALGYSDSEFKRLEFQATLVRDLTVNVLRRAGIGHGMRVLDIGCGIGDVSLLAAEIVGPSGLVVGVDRSPDAVALAERRAVAAGKCHWTHFAVAELDEFSPNESFDAVIGRFILMYLPDPAATLRRLSGHVRPGGTVVFQEMAMAMTRCIPEGPLFRECVARIIGTFERAGFETDMGAKLFTTFLDAGLPAPQMIASNHAGGGPDSPVYDYISETMRSLLPVAERLGVVTAAEADVDTLAERLRQETVGQKACIMLPPLVGAWAHTTAH
jgi:SAM-dependent methyltransferase